MQQGLARRSTPSALVLMVAALTSASVASAGGMAAAASGSPAPSQPPSSLFLDPAFGTGGLAATAGFGGDRSAMALQPDGRIVMVGGTFADFVVARFDANGVLDATFGDAGIVTTDMIPDKQEEALAVAIAADGGIVVAGYSGFDATVALARYLPDGSLDPAFGSGGRVVGTLPGRGYAMAIEPDGAIVVAGESDVQGRGDDFEDLLVARFRPDGTLDPTFGDGGQVRTDVAAVNNEARNLVLLPDGGVVVSGEPVGDIDGADHTELARYDADGHLDAGFGTNGVLELPGARIGEGLALQGDGRLVLVGRAIVAEERRFAVMRLDSNGTPDDTFGDGGLVTTDVADQGDAATAVAIQPDGRIVVAGRSGDINTDFAVARYLADGSLDDGFANHGTLTVDFFMLPDIAESVALQPDGMIVLGGFAQHDVDGYGLARVLP